MLQDIYDEPFADSSQIPSYLLSAMTRKCVTVALLGDGGDEVFAGYDRYVQGLAFARMIRTLPKPMRKVIAEAVTVVRPDMWDSVSRLLPARIRPRLLGYKLHKLAGVLPQDSIGFYRHVVTQWPEASALVRGAAAPDDGLYASELKHCFRDEVAWMQFLDTGTYSPDDILTKVDRASMAVGLEVRVPLLDHRLVELSWRLPLHLKIRRGVSKWVLRQIAYKHGPKKLLELRKWDSPCRLTSGYGAP